MAARSTGTVATEVLEENEATTAPLLTPALNEVELPHFDPLTLGESEEEWVFMRRRPCHAGRFLAFARRNFGALARDLDPARGAVSSAARDGDEETPGIEWRAAVAKGSGLLWFAGSDDLAAEWRYAAAGQGGTSKEGQHLLRCGTAWPSGEVAEDVHDVIGIRAAGTRRTETIFVLHGSADARAAAKAALEVEMRGCLLTRQEADAIDAGGHERDAVMQDGFGEWEEERLTHQQISMWADRARPLLVAVNLLASYIGLAPGAQQISSVGSRVAAWLVRKFRVGHHANSELDMTQCSPCL
jgi:hypothetical protein